MQCSLIQKQIEPYISGKIEGKELEEFVNHIETCDECYEELEIYYTIAIAMKQFDNESEVSYDIRNRLIQDLKDSAGYIRRQKIFHTYRRAIYLTSMVIVALALGIQLFLWLS